MPRLGFSISGSCFVTLSSVTLSNCALLEEVMTDDRVIVLVFASLDCVAKVDVNTLPCWAFPPKRSGHRP
jgi:hypothetical protein